MQGTAPARFAAGPHIFKYRPINIRQIKSLPDYQLLGRILTRLAPPQSEAPGGFAGAVSVRGGGGGRDRNFFAHAKKVRWVDGERA